MGLSPRSHNATSYAGAALVYVLVLPQPELSLASILWITHFTRRALESLFLFHFSQPEVPLADSIQEFVYYWAFAAWIGASVRLSDGLGAAQVTGAAVWLFAEGANFFCHCTLAAQKGSKKDGARRIVMGPLLFSQVSCPHYFFEILSWVGFNIATNFTRAGVAFAAVGALIMTCWAIQKHESYVKCRRTPIFPFLDVRPPQFLVEALAKK